MGDDLAGLQFAGVVFGDADDQCLTLTLLRRAPRTTTPEPSLVRSWSTRSRICDFSSESTRWVRTFMPFTSTACGSCTRDGGAGGLHANLVELAAELLELVFLRGELVAQGVGVLLRR